MVVMVWSVSFPRVRFSMIHDFLMSRHITERRRRDMHFSTEILMWTFFVLLCHVPQHQSQVVDKLCHPWIVHALSQLLIASKQDLAGFLALLLLVSAFSSCSVLCFIVSHTEKAFSSTSSFAAHHKALFFTQDRPTSPLVHKWNNTKSMNV